MIYSDSTKIEIIMMKKQLRIASISSYEYWCYSLIPFPNIFMILQVWPHLRFQCNFFLHFHFFTSFISLRNQFAWKNVSGISWLAIMYQIVICFTYLIIHYFQWVCLISPLQSVHLHRQQFWQRMNQNVEIGSLPICFNLLDNLFVFV